MSYATIMVHLDRLPDSGRRVTLACGLADLFEANIIGVASCLTGVSAFFDDAATADRLIDEADRETQASIAEVERVFKALAGRRNAIKFRANVIAPTRFLIDQSCMADLLVVGRKAGGDGHAKPRHIILPENPIASEIVDAAAAQKADLIVAGADG